MARSAVILGAGFAGLWAGAELLKRGFDVQIYERTPQPGGLLRSFTWNDLTVDIGPHIYFRDHTDYYEQYLERPLERVEAYYAFGFRGRQIRSPVTPRNMLRDLPFPNFVLLAFSFLWARILAGKAVPVSAQDWAINKYGGIAYRYFFRDYIPKLTGLDASQVSPDWGNDRERFYKQHNLMGKTLKLRSQFSRSDINPAPPLELYFAPGGAQAIIEGLCRFIEGHGGQINTGYRLERICRTAGRQVSAAVIKNDSGQIAVAGDYVVSTLALPNLVRHIDNVPATVLDSAGQLRFRNLRCIYFIIRRKRLMDKMQIYFTDKKYIFKRVYETPLVRGDEQEHTCVCAEVCYTPGDAISSMPVNELTTMVGDQLLDCYHLNADELEASFTFDAPDAYAVYGLNYRKHLQIVAEFLYGIDNLISFGRAGLFRYNALTDRIIDAGKGMLEYIDANSSKAAFLNGVRPKGDFL